MERHPDIVETTSSYRNLSLILNQTPSRGRRQIVNHWSSSSKNQRKSDSTFKKFVKSVNEQIQQNKDAMGNVLDSLGPPNESNPEAWVVEIIRSLGTRLRFSSSAVTKRTPLREIVNNLLYSDIGQSLDLEYS